MNKKGFEFSFAWFFAILVGAVILFMAIYSITKLTDVSEETSSTMVSQQINVLLNPLETGFQSASVTSFSLSIKTRIRNDCTPDNKFGMQRILISEYKRNQWSKFEGYGQFYNKYIFSENVSEGNKFHLFSKPFEPIFKVNDYIYLIPEGKQYCFKNPPEEIKEDIESLNTSFMKIDDHEEEYLRCKEDSILVCFNGGDCDIEVDINNQGGGRILKDSNKIDSGTVYFLGDEEDSGMIFAGIFASPYIYECQIDRMMKRLGTLSEIYKDKINYLSNVGCNSNVNFDPLMIATRNYEESSEIKSINDLIQQIKEEYGYSPMCRIW